MKNNKEVELVLMRHGTQVTDPENPCIWQMQAPLSPEGRAEIKRIKDVYFADVEFDVFGSSSALRAQQTTNIICGRPPSVWSGWSTYGPLGPASVEAWNHAFVPWPEDKPFTVVTAWELQKGLLYYEGQKTFKFLCEAAIGMNHAQRGLFTSHQPIIEMAVTVALGQFPPTLSLKKGQFVRYVFRNDALAEVIPPQ